MFSLYRFLVSQYSLEKSELEKKPNNSIQFYNVATLWEIFEQHTLNKSFVRHTGIICRFNNCMCLSVVMVLLHVCRLAANTAPYTQTEHFEAVVRLLMNDEFPTDLNVQKY